MINTKYIRIIPLIMFIIVVLLISPFFTIFAVNQEALTSILVIYSNQSEIDGMNQIFNENDIDAEIDSVTFQNLDSIDLFNYNFLVLLSSTEFNIPDTSELEILDFLEDPFKSILVFTPYIDEFGDELEITLGFDDIDEELLEDEEIVNWNIKLDNTIGNLLKDESFDYTGLVGKFTPISSVQVLASVISSNSTDSDILELEYPFPVVINATLDKSIIISSSLSPIENSNKDNNGFKLNQFPFFSSLITEIITSTIKLLEIRITNSILSTQGSKSTTDSNITSPNDIRTNNPAKNFSVPNLESNNFLYLLILFIIISLALLFKKILEIFRWFTYKTFGVFIFIFGAFYNIQDRILDHNDVLINQSRADIVDFLEYIGKYGAHLREIKSIMKMGTGSLLWHLQVLEDFGWITKIKINNFTVFIGEDFADNFDPKLKLIELKLQSKYSKVILETIINHKSMEWIDISLIEQQTKVHRKTLRRQLKKMYAHNLIDIIIEKSMKISVINENALSSIYESLWKRQAYTQNQSNISVNSI